MNYFSILLLVLLSCSAQNDISTLSNKELFGQMVMLGIKDKHLSETEKRWLNEYSIGSLLLLKRNIPSTADSVIQVIKGYQSHLSEPALVSIDQENGWISRLHGVVTELPNNYALGKLNSLNTTKNIAEISGKELLALGIHWSLSPVADVNSNPKNPIIGVRSFGENTSIVQKHSLAYIDGLNSAGVLSSIKHFPGHGDTSFDSHYDKVIIYKDQKELESIDLVPFNTLGNSKHPQPTSVMIGHILLPKIDSVPATISKKIMGFIPSDYTGLKVADELEMNALAKFYNPYKAVVTMIENGMDVIIMARALKQRVDVDSLFTYVDAYTAKSATFRNRLIESVTRIKKQKARFKNHTPSLKTFNQLRDTHRAYASQVFKEIPYFLSGSIPKEIPFTFSKDAYTQEIVKRFNLALPKSEGKPVQFVSKKTNEVNPNAILISIENPYVLDSFQNPTKICFYNRYAPIHTLFNLLFKGKQ
mgnify:CR=1 FL=1